ncbi:MAG: hypothetical protein GTO18_18320 [Anaerolineales bacterium]|nr:hypothetical protein [Anaerolineales bacterium]
MKRLVLALSIVILLVLAFPMTAFAGGVYEGRVVFGSTFTLESGEILDGDLLIFGGNAILETDSLVDGDVAVLGGNVNASGSISGDVLVLGGDVNLQSGSVVEGDVLTFGGNVTKNPNAIVEGEIFSETSFYVPFDFRGPRIRPIIPGMGFWAASTTARVAGVFFQAIVLAALAMLVVLFWEKQTRQVAETAIDQPVMSGGLGILAMILVWPIAFVLVLTCCLIPLAFVGLIVFAAAVIFGLIALGYEIGYRLAQSFKWRLSPSVEAGIGSLLLGLVVGAIGLIPCVGWLALFFAASLGLGSVILTRFGSQPYVYVSASARSEIVEAEPEAAEESGEETEEE